MIKLQKNVIAMCIEHGERVVKAYAEGAHEESRALSILGAEANPTLQAEGKMAECVLAVERGLDPTIVVNWSGKPELDGIDLVVDGISVDVKAVRPGRRFLIWSVGKIGKLESKKFEAFVLVRCQLDRRR